MEREDRDSLLIYHLESWREGVWPEWVTRVTSGPSESQVSPPPGSGGLSDLGVRDVGPGGQWKHVLECGSRTKQAAPSADGAHTRTAQPRPHLEPSGSAALSVCPCLSRQKLRPSVLRKPLSLPHFQFPFCYYCWNLLDVETQADHAPREMFHSISLLPPTPGSRAHWLVLPSAGCPRACMLPAVRGAARASSPVPLQQGPRGRRVAMVIDGGTSLDGG